MRDFPGPRPSVSLIGAAVPTARSAVSSGDGVHPRVLRKFIAAMFSRRRSGFRGEGKNGRNRDLSPLRLFPF